MKPMIAVLYFDWSYLIYYAYYFIFIAAIYTFLFIAATIPILRRYSQRSSEDIHSLLQSDSLPPLTFIVPAYNESKNIAKTVKTMLKLSYRYKEIIVVNDGSTDETLDILIQHFDLVKKPIPYIPKIPTGPIRGIYQSEEHPELFVIDKINGGKGDALNSALNIAKSPIHVCSDADTLIDERALPYLIRPFLEDPKTLVVSSSICIANGCKFGTNRIIEYGFPHKWLVGFQVVEYLRGIFLDRMGLNWTKGALVVPGAFGLFKSESIIEIGGYSRESIVEDMDIIMKLHRFNIDEKRDYHVTFIPDPIAWTEAPQTLSALYKQRRRWYVGTTHCMWDYLGMCFNPRYKSIGLFVFPYYLIDKFISPVVETSAYIIVAAGIYLGVLDLYLMITVGLIGWAFMTILTFLCIMVEEVTYRKYPSWRATMNLLICTILDNVSYHFLILWWKLRGMIFFRRQRRKWHGTPRAGYDNISDGAAFHDQINP